MNTQATLKMAAEAAGVGTWDLDVQKGELHTSPRTRQIFGFNPAVEVKYDDLLNVIHPEDRPGVRELIDAATDPNGPGAYETEYRLLLPDGEVRWVGARGKAHFETIEDRRQATRFVGTILDCTAGKLAQQALVESEKLAQTGRLAASLAHEIRNPLSTIGDLLYLLRGELSEERRVEYLSQAERELARVTEIANTTLRFYRDPGGATAFDLADLAQSVLTLFHGRIAMQQLLVNAYLPSGILVSVPQGEFRQVLVNLVGNALDAVPRGGRLILRVRKLKSLDGSSFVGLTVADTGKGMSPAVQGRIFEPFYTTKGQLGTGIGLWLSLEILKKCKASIRLRSKPGCGTVFCIYLNDVGTAPPTFRRNSGRRLTDRAPIKVDAPSQLKPASTAVHGN